MPNGMKSLKMMAADGWKGAIWALAEIAKLKAEIKLLKSSKRGRADDARAD